MDAPTNRAVTAVVRHLHEQDRAADETLAMVGRLAEIVTGLEERVELLNEDKQRLQTRVVDLMIDLDAKVSRPAHQASVDQVTEAHDRLRQRFDNLEEALRWYADRRALRSQLGRWGVIHRLRQVERRVQQLRTRAGLR